MTSVEQLWARGISVQEPTPLGWEPIAITAIFSKGQDWIVALQPTSTPAVPVWPTGATITVNIYSSTTDTSMPLSQWPLECSEAATIEGNTVYARIPSSTCDTVECGALIRVMVSLPDALDADQSDEFCWLRGLVSRRD